MLQNEFRKTVFKKRKDILSPYTMLLGFTSYVNAYIYISSFFAKHLPEWRGLYACMPVVLHKG